jgi:hypothetical protein
LRCGDGSGVGGIDGRPGSHGRGNRGVAGEFATGDAPTGIFGGGDLFGLAFVVHGRAKEATESSQERQLGAGTLCEHTKSTHALKFGHLSWANPIYPIYSARFDLMPNRLSSKTLKGLLAALLLVASIFLVAAKKL